MPYGDRTSVASDTFDSAISADWENGPGAVWANWSWATGGIIRPTNGADSLLGRVTETFADDQYSTITMDNAPHISSYTGCSVRQTNASPDCYAAYSSDGANRYEIYRAASGGLTLLANTATGWAALGAGNTVTVEAEGTTIRIGDNRGTDTERLSTTDATYSGGQPGIVAYVESTDHDVTAWDGGDIGAANDPIAGTSSLALSGSAGLNLDAALNGTAALAFSESASLGLDAALNGTSALAFTNTGALDTLMALDGSAVITVTPVADLSYGGANAIEGTVDLAFSVTGSLDLGAAIAGTVPLAFTPVGDVLLRGVLAGTVPMAFTPSADLQALSASALQGSIPLEFALAGTLDARGALEGSVLLALTPVLNYTPVADETRRGGGSGGPRNVILPPRPYDADADSEPDARDRDTEKVLLMTLAAADFLDIL